MSNNCNKCNITLPTTFKYCPSCGTEINPPVKAKQKRRTKGNGTVYKLSGNRTKPWAVKLNGSFLDCFEDRPTAEKFLAEKRLLQPESINISLKGVYDRYLATDNHKNLTAGGKYNYKLAWDKMQNIHNMKMRDIKTSHFQQCINKAHGEGTGKDGCAKVRTLASILCREAMKDDIILQDYSKNLELPKYVQEVKRRNLTQEEILTLMYADKDRDARIILCMLYTATRISELFSIRKNAVNLETRTMIGGSKTDAGINRIIVIRDEIFPYIVEFMAESGDYLISSPTGKKLNSDNFRNRNFYTLLDRVGIEYKDENGNNTLTPHRTRHTYISESIMAGVRPEALKRIVGHANYATSVDVYDDVVNVDFLKKEAKKGL